MNKKQSIPLLSCCLLICLLSPINADLADSAKGYVGWTYEQSPLPETDVYGNPRIKGNLVGNMIDCSGLIDVAAPLSMRYTASDIHGKLTQAISWGDLQRGDILTNGSHVIVFVGWLDGEHNRMDTIEASSGKKIVIEKNRIPQIGDLPEQIQYYGYLNPGIYPQCDLANMGFRPSRWKADTTPPIVTINGVKDGKLYFHKVTIEYHGNDPNCDPFPFVTGKLNGKPFEQKVPITIEKNGSYIVEAQATDWRGNSSALKTITFSIAESPSGQGITSSSSDGNGGWIQRKYMVTDWGQKAGGGGFCPGRSGYPMTTNADCALSIHFYTPKYSPTVRVNMNRAEGKWSFAPGNRGRS